MPEVGRFTLWKRPIARIRRRRNSPRWLMPACWAFLASMLAAWLAFWVGEERWWPVTLLIYGPRWPYAVPLAILAPIAAFSRPALLAPLAVAAGIILGPIWGLCFPGPSSWIDTSERPRLRVMTLNTQGEHLDLNALRELVAQAWPDIVMLQEWSGGDPAAAFPWEGWEFRESFGLCLASRLPIARDEMLPPTIMEDRGRAARYEILVHGESFGLANIHLPTPRVGLQAMLESHRGGVEILEEDNRLRRRLSDLASRWAGEDPGPRIVAGDFNLPSDASIFRASWSGLADAFEEAGLGFGPTKFTRWHGVRIDHILVGPGWRARECWVGPDVGSDHRPVLADIEFPPLQATAPARRRIVQVGHPGPIGPAPGSHLGDPRPKGSRP